MLIDVDHIFDYYMAQGKKLKIKEFYRWCTENRFKFIFLPFHSFELLFLLWVAVVFWDLGIFWIAFAVGLTQHMILDAYFNRKVLGIYGYLLLFRAIKGFRKEGVRPHAASPVLKNR